jgi:hypothetical protein
MSSSAGSNGVLDGRANAAQFRAWQQEVEDFKPYISQGTLNISKVSRESGVDRNAFYSNPEIRDQLLPELLDVLESRGLLKARVAMPATVVVQERRSASTSDAVVKRLMEQNEAYKAEIAELRKELKKQNTVRNMLLETGRMPW